MAGSHACAASRHAQERGGLWKDGDWGAVGKLPSLHGRPAGRPYDRRRDTIPPYALARVPEKPRRGERLTKDVGAHGVRPKPADKAKSLLKKPSRQRKREGEYGLFNSPAVTNSRRP